MHISFYAKVCQLAFYKYIRQDSFASGYNEFLQLDAGLSAVKSLYVFCYKETTQLHCTQNLNVWMSWHCSSSMTLTGGESHVSDINK